MTTDELLLKGGALSAAPQVACKLNRLLKSEAFTDEIVEVVQYDPTLTARILQICNTPAYRGRNGASSLQEAINRLGNETIRRIVWQVSMGSQMGGSLPAYCMQAGSLWRHSITTAIAAEELWKLSAFEEDMGTAFTAALLHDVGKILTNVAITFKNDSFREYIEEEKMPVHDAESALLGFNHAEMGGLLLMKWGQSEPLVAAVAHHHHPEKAPNGRLATLVCVANQCTHHYEEVLQKQKNSRAANVSIPDHILDTLQISLLDLEKVMKAIQKRTAEVEVFMAIM